MTPFWTGLVVGLIIGASITVFMMAIFWAQDEATPEDDAEQVRELKKWVERQ